MITALKYVQGGNQYWGVDLLYMSLHLMASSQCSTTGTKEHFNYLHLEIQGAGYSSVVRAFAHVAMGRRIDPSWGGPIELFLVPASAPAVVCAILSGMVHIK